MKISFQILLLPKVFNLMRFSLICFAFFGFHQLYCQTFTAEPSVLLEKSINLNAANECYIHFEDNNSIDSLYLKWRLVESSIPPGLDYRSLRLRDLLYWNPFREKNAAGTRHRTALSQITGLTGKYSGRSVAVVQGNQCV